MIIMAFTPLDIKTPHFTGILLTKCSMTPFNLKKDCILFPSEEMKLID